MDPSGGSIKAGAGCFLASPRCQLRSRIRPAPLAGVNSPHPAPAAGLRSLSGEELAQRCSMPGPWLWSHGSHADFSRETPSRLHRFAVFLRVFPCFSESGLKQLPARTSIASGMEQFSAALDWSLPSQGVVFQPHTRHHHSSDRVTIYDDPRACINSFPVFQRLEDSPQLQ